MYPFVLLCKLNCTDFVILEVFVDDRIWRSTADVQIIGCISNSNLSS